MPRPAGSRSARPRPGEAELAELLRERTTVGGTRLFDSVRLVSTGTEATMTAVRLARGATGRDLIIKFAGHYHGHSDGLLAESGSGVATLGLPGSAGVPADVAALTIVLPYNDLAAVEATFAAHPGRIAAIITEAAGANAGVLVPDARVQRGARRARAPRGRAPDPRRGAHRLPRRSRRVVGAGGRARAEGDSGSPTS